jgi:hypothetical protein
MNKALSLTDVPTPDDPPRLREIKRQIACALERAMSARMAERAAMTEAENLRRELAQLVLGIKIGDMCSYFDGHGKVLQGKLGARRSADGFTLQLLTPDGRLSGTLRAITSVEYLTPLAPFA